MNKVIFGFLIYFTVEILVKGFLLSFRTYVQYPWHRFDMFFTLVGWIALIIDQYTSFRSAARYTSICDMVSSHLKHMNCADHMMMVWYMHAILYCTECFLDQCFLSYWMCHAYAGAGILMTISSCMYCGGSAVVLLFFERFGCRVYWLCHLGIHSPILWSR